MRKLYSALAIVTLSIAACSKQDPAGLSLVNPGFENDLEGWKVTTPDEKVASARVTADAAREGSKGLHIIDESLDQDVLIAQTERFPVRPGKTYEVTYQARAPKNNKGICVFMRFFDKDESQLQSKDDHRILSEIDPDSPEWKEYSFEGLAPKGAVEMDVYIRTNKRGIVQADLDDFRLAEK